MRFDRMLVINRSLITKLLTCICGIYIGLNVSHWIQGRNRHRRIERCFIDPASNTLRHIVDRRPLSQELQTKGFIFAGVMTAGKFLGSRASVVYNTWGKSLSGKVEFFAGNNTANAINSEGLPLVSLPGVDDSYPPQRKSFMMLKYMHDNYIDQFEWFIRSDDDVYIRTDKLEAFLRRFDSSEDLFIGQAGVGARDEHGRLGLGPLDNFCMGGTGMVMSHSVLKKLAPHLESCLENLLSNHEDVEIGRCIKKYVGVSCTWAFEMQWLFYHNQTKSNAFHWDLETKAVQNAITLHPIKDPKYMYRLHIHFLTKKIQTLQYQSLVKASLLRQLDQFMQENPGAKELTKLKEVKDLRLTTASNTTLHWEVFGPKRLFTTTMSSPTLVIRNSIRRSLNVVLRESLALINQDSRKVLFRELSLSRVNLGYIRISPMQGIQYLLDLRMISYQHIGFSRRKLSLNVHYQAHMQQPFGSLVYSSSSVSIRKPIVHIILPLTGRLKEFAAFLSNFEKVVLVNDEKVKLLIMYFPDVSPYSNHQNILRIYNESYPNFEVIWKPVKGPFSRGLALQLGVSYFGPHALLFFCDVDLVFDMEFLDRCREHSVRGKRVYYPMVFSQFNHSIGNLTKSTSHLHGDKGFWRRYGFGMVCVYGEDVTAVGGFDTNIQGWGLEDVRLFEKFVSIGRYDVIRAPDPGLIHIYHKASCSSDLEPNRLRSCETSKMSQLASSSSLMDHMEKRGYL